MPFGFIYQCNKCFYEVTVSSGWEFYIDQNGTRKRSDHLGRSAEAKQAGVKGFTAEWYCRQCQEVREAVVVEYSLPRNGPLDSCLAYSDPNVERKYFLAVCSECNSVLVENLNGLPCPCGKGKFKESGRFMS
jgi:Zn finger protein HypA/HybF involved in hydrogenase expression